MSKTPAEDAVRTLFAAVDAGDLNVALQTMTDDVRFSFGSTPATRGAAGFAASAAVLADMVKSMSHDLSTIWTTQGADPAVICEMTVTYHRHDGTMVSLPCVNVFRFRDALIADYRIYMDISPVLATSAG
jgi:ketosteroid isomerase-like protein